MVVFGFDFYTGFTKKIVLETCLPRKQIYRANNRVALKRDIISHSKLSFYTRGANLETHIQEEKIKIKHNEKELSKTVHGATYQIAKSTNGVTPLCDSKEEEAVVFPALHNVDCLVAIVMEQ